jgi:adenylate kinase
LLTTWRFDDTKDSLRKIPAQTKNSIYQQYIREIYNRRKLLIPTLKELQ